MELKSLPVVVLDGLLPLETQHFFILQVSNLHLPLLLQHLQLLQLLPLLVVLLLWQSALPIDSILLDQAHHHLLVPLTIEPHSLVDLLQEVPSLQNLWNIDDLISMRGLRSFPLPAPTLLILPNELLNPLRRYYLLCYQFLFKELQELLIFQILLQTLSSQALPFLRVLKDSADAVFIGVHEADHGQEDGPDVPARAPSFLVVVSEGGADGLADLEPAIVGKEADLRRRERVILGQLQQSVIETIPEIFIQVVEDKMENQVPISVQENRRDGLFFNGLQFLLYAYISYSLVHWLQALYSLLKQELLQSPCKS